MQGVSMVPGFTLLNADTEEGGGGGRTGDQRLDVFM